MVSNYTVDEAMTTGKSQIQADVKEGMLAELTSRKVGLTVVNITIQDSAPPTDEIIAAFKAVETAKQGADTAMNNAYQYQNQKIPEAEANAEADNKERERIDKINQADSVAFQTENFLKENGDKVPAEDKPAIEAAIEELKKAKDSGDVAQIDAAINALNEKMQAASQKMYAAGAQPGAGHYRRYDVDRLCIRKQTEDG